MDPCWAARWCFQGCGAIGQPRAAASRGRQRLAGGSARWHPRTYVASFPRLPSRSEARHPPWIEPRLIRFPPTLSQNPCEPEPSPHRWPTRRAPTVVPPAETGLVPSSAQASPRAGRRLAVPRQRIRRAPPTNPGPDRRLSPSAAGGSPPWSLLGACCWAGAGPSPHVKRQAAWGLPAATTSRPRLTAAASGLSVLAVQLAVAASLLFSPATAARHRARARHLGPRRATRYAPAVCPARQTTAYCQAAGERDNAAPPRCRSRRGGTSTGDGPVLVSQRACETDPLMG